MVENSLQNKEKQLTKYTYSNVIGRQAIDIINIINVVPVGVFIFNLKH